MADYTEQFNTAVNIVNNLKKRPSDEILLTLYGFYKQATEGDNVTPQPSVFSLKKKSKWEAWNKNKGMAKDQAQLQYISLALKLKS